MERKKKHSIIWLVVIVVAILAIVLITVIGAGKNGNTAEAYTGKDLQVNTRAISDLPTTINPNIWVNGGFAINTTGKTTWENPNGPILDYYNMYDNLTTTKVILNKDNYSIEIVTEGELDSDTPEGYCYINLYNTGMIGKTLKAGSYTFSVVTSHPGYVSQLNLPGINNAYNFTRNGNLIYRTFTLSNDAKINNNLLVQFRWFPGDSNFIIYGIKLETGTVCTAPLGLQNYDEIYNEGKNDGYEEGITDGESLYRNNPFNGAALISAIVIKDNYKITDAPLNLLSNGISFNDILLAVDDHVAGKEEFEGESGWSVTFSVRPFIFQQNQIYISRSYGFASLIITDTNNNTYNLSWDTTLTQLGYAITGSTAYGKTIKQIKITFANLDDVGYLQVGKSAEQDSAYTEGYNKGYNQGHRDGYNQATTDSNGPAWAINKLVSTVSAGLSTDIIGEISIGDILSVMLGILLTFAVIRFFGGG